MGAEKRDEKPIIEEKDHRDARLMVSRQFVTVPLRFARSIVIVPLLTPEIMFVVRLIATWFAYLPKLTLGSLAVLTLYYPEAQGKGDEETCARYRQLAWRSSLVAAAVGCTVGIVISIRFLDGALILPLMMWGVLRVMMEYGQSSFRATGHFGAIARIAIVQAVTTFAFSLVGVIAFELAGYVWGLFLSTALLVWMSRETFFPPAAKLAKAWVTRTIGTGLHLWANSFLRQLCKNWEITMLAVTSVFARGAAGQYAVALTLVEVMGQVMTSINTVFQRKLTMRLGGQEAEERDYAIVFDFSVFNTQLFMLSTVPILLGAHVLVALVPGYEALPALLPALLFAAYLIRTRFYPSVAFRLERKLGSITIPDAIHLILGVMGFMAVVRTEAGLLVLAVVQVGCAIIGTATSWALMGRYLGNTRGPMWRMVSLTVGTAVWMAGATLTADDIPLQAAIIVGGWAVLFMMGKIWFPGAHDLLRQTTIDWLERLLRRWQKRDRSA